jgi:hypothetical protein
LQIHEHGIHLRAAAEELGGEHLGDRFGTVFRQPCVDRLGDRQERKFSMQKLSDETTLFGRLCQQRPRNSGNSAHMSLISLSLMRQRPRLTQK